MTSPPFSLPLPDVRLNAGLYLVATPIGHLADITLRALATLHQVDLILCEDTRVTGKLLAHYDIQKPLRVYNDPAEGRDHGDLIAKMQVGAKIALVSDAGMPLLSDPGYKLVRACLEVGVAVTSLPGASAILTALQLSGLPSDAFLFLGFLPNRASDRRRRLAEVAAVPATLILFERASRVPDVLADIAHALGPRSVTIARELTKMFEEVRRGTPDELIADIAARAIKGEVVMVIDRASETAALSDEEVLDKLRGLMATESMRDAVDQVTQMYNLPRRRVYDIALGLKDQS